MSDLLPKRKKTPIARALTVGPTFWTGSEIPANVLEMEREIIRDGKPTKVRVVLSSDTKLPILTHRQYLDVLIKIFVDAGKPATNLVPIRVNEVIAARGLSRSGYNYREFFEAVQKFKSMQITYYDAWKVAGKSKTGRKYAPKVSGKSIIEEYDLENPERQGSGKSSVDRAVGWVRFTKWFASSLRDDMGLVDQQILAQLNVGYTYRVYEFVSQSMGKAPVWEIGMMKLGLALPFTVQLETKRKIESLKRAFKQLTETGAFETITTRGRGSRMIARFIAKGANPSISPLKDPSALNLDAEAGFQHPTLFSSSGPEIEPLDAFHARLLSDLRQLMTKEALSEGRAKSAAFQKDLNETGAIFAATVDKYRPTREEVTEALSETRAFLREGSIKTTVRQFFIQKLGEYTGKKNFSGR